MAKNRILSFKAIANVALWIMLLGGVVFTLGFGLSLTIARQEVTKEVDAKVQSQINYLEAYVDGHLQRIEDAGFAFCSNMFGKCVSDDIYGSYVELDPVFIRPTPEECFLYIHQFMEANPLICGIAIEFEPSVYSDIESTYGFTPYVTRLSGDFEQLDLGMITNSFEWEWYIVPNKLKRACWVSPFRDSSIGHVIASYTIPIFVGGNKFAVIAVDIDTEAFSSKSKEVSPYPGATVTMLDNSFRFISHPNDSHLLRTPDEVNESEDCVFDENVRKSMEVDKSGRFRIVANGEKSLFYFAPIERTGWMVTIQCPEKEVYGGVNRMKHSTTIIALISILVMVLSLLLIFRNLQSVSIAKAGMENELKVASAIQMDMLPKSYPAFPDRSDLDIYGFQKSAKSVGGDLYDYFIRDGKLFFCLGDVSGKGVPAALYMAVIRSLFRNVAMQKDEPDEIVGSINNTIAEGNVNNMFCTYFLGILDLTTGHLEYCNGGHNTPLVKRTKPDGTFDVHFAHVMKRNLAIGVMEDFPYMSESIDLDPGDVILLYTDGVTEAENANKDLFGDDATREAFERSIKQSVTGAKGYVENVYDSVRIHTSGAEQNDDITMLSIEFIGPMNGLQV